MKNDRISKKNIGFAHMYAVCSMHNAFYTNLHEKLDEKKKILKIHQEKCTKQQCKSKTRTRRQRETSERCSTENKNLL